MALSDAQIDVFRERILDAAKNKTSLSIEGGGTKSWYGNPNSYAKLDTRSYSGILEYQPEELVITACAGTPLKEIEATLKEKKQVLAFEPPHFGENATFGGAIATGLAGPGRITVGFVNTFEWSRLVEVTHRGKLLKCHFIDIVLYYKFFCSHTVFMLI